MNDHPQNYCILNKVERLNADTFSGPAAIQVYNQEEKLEKYEESLIKRFCKGKTLLDIGCGCGRTTICLQKMGFEVIGIDVVPEMIAIAQNKFPEIDFRIMNACDLKFKDKTFDNVLFSFNGIDYIYPKKKRVIALKEIYRVLKPNGAFIFTSHNPLYFPCRINHIKSHIKFLFNNFISLRIFTNYREENLSYGTLITYYANPISQKRNLVKVGFKHVEIIDRNFRGFLHAIFLDPFPAYVGIK
ncbi:MAG: methyltransferase domain-containing protein [Planctomycetota bacterium]|nr:methyltransferase domain-containing protein [Planctomycetota bacterium]